MGFLQEYKEAEEMSRRLSREMTLVVHSVEEDSEDPTRMHPSAQYVERARKATRTAKELARKLTSLYEKLETWV